MTSLLPQPAAPVIRLRSPRDALATVPRLLGYRPRDSIVFLSLHGGGEVSTLRVDLPRTVDAEGERAAATTLAGLLCRVPEVRTLIVAVYTEEPIGEGREGGPPGLGLVERLLERLLASGFAVHDALCVAADGWTAYHGADAGLRHPLAELEAPAPGDLGDVPVAEGLAALAALPRVGGAERRAFARALERLLGEGTAAAGGLLPSPDPVGPASGHMSERGASDGASGTTEPPSERASPVAVAESAIALDPRGPEPAVLARLLVALLHPDERDVVLYAWAWGPARARRLRREARRIRAGLEPRDDALMLDLLGLGEAPPPDRSRLTTAVAVLRRLAALSPASLRHVPLTALAWSHWALGQSSLAARHLDEARGLAPDHGLAELLHEAIGAGLLPGWAYRMPRR